MFNLNREVSSNARICCIVLLIAVTGLLLADRIMTASADEELAGAMQARLAQSEERLKTLDLATEFGFDPLVVQVVRKLSADAINGKRCGSCTTWRFVKTEDDLSYLMLSIIQVESRGDYRAYNPDGPAHGLTQLLLSTARAYNKNVQPSELLTIPTNLTIAMNHFVDLLEKFHGNYTLAVLAWNRGAGAVDRSIALGNSPENGYARAVFTQAALRNASN